MTVTSSYRLAHIVGGLNFGSPTFLGAEFYWKRTYAFLKMDKLASRRQFLRLFFQFEKFASFRGVSALFHSIKIDRNPTLNPRKVGEPFSLSFHISKKHPIKDAI